MEKALREATFISIFYFAQVGFDQGNPPPSDLPAVFRLSGLDGGIEAEMMKHFPDGLVYRPTPTSFTLEEPNQRFVSLFYRDRLISTDQNWPSWEKSGEKASK